MVEIFILKVILLNVIFSTQTFMPENTDTAGLNTEGIQGNGPHLRAVIRGGGGDRHPRT